MRKTCTLLALSFIAVASLFAQDGQQQPPQGEGHRGHRPPPPPPVMLVLDANDDHVLDANEIANASAALRQLDKNGDGQLTDEELRPPCPEGRPENGGNGNQGRPGRR
jgi:hypothetical protein